MQLEEAYVAPGMPPLQTSGRTVSFFEFWPMWLMYVPVVLQWLLLACRNWSLTLPLIANPKLPVSGMMGVGKSEIMKQATGSCSDTILPWLKYRIRSGSTVIQAIDLSRKLMASEILFPFVCKPDIGCRGAGVKLIQNPKQLEQYLCAYPKGAEIVIQKLASWEPEAGIFFVRRPGEEKGRVVSLALKYSPYVVGDGVSTLADLIAKDGRAGNRQHLYTQRHQNRLHDVIEQGAAFRLVFSITHSKGGIFRDGNHLITPELTDHVNQLMSDIPEFHYGRLDVKFSDIESLTLGKNIEILEINMASAESLHIWDRNARLSTALKTLLWQHKTLFEFGKLNRVRGFSPPTLSEVLNRWRTEKQLASFYPITD